MIAKTAAAGGSTLLPEVLAFTSSLALDGALLFDDILGSMAHVMMLGKQRILAAPEACALRSALSQLLLDAQRGAWQPAGEEDVHMAVEAKLQQKLGSLAGKLHTARSRNDQVAVDLKLYLRQEAAAVLHALAGCIDALLRLAARHETIMLPGYTHRQRAQPITVPYLMAAYASMLARDVCAMEFVLQGLSASPLGVGALAGTSFPIDRTYCASLLHFSSITDNGLDTIGDRDFALDFVYATARCSLHISRMATDVVDFTSTEFGFVELDDAIACGSSMMPQKRNPDLFELLRGKSGPATAALMSLMVTLKGLPVGYQRDLQEDRQVVLQAGPNLCASLRLLATGIDHIRINAARCAQTLKTSAAQATDLAESLVMQGLPFRSAYQAVGELVSQAQAQGLHLSDLPRASVAQILPDLCEAGYEALSLASAVRNKVSPGGPQSSSVAVQIQKLREVAAAARSSAQAVPTRDALFEEIMAVQL